METAHFSQGEGSARVEAALVLCGEDMAVVVGGGTRPHIGAAAVAAARPSLRGDGRQSATASVICQPSHQDDLPARELALKLAARHGGTVTVTVGLHVDAAGQEDIERLLENFRGVSGKILEWLKA